MNCSYLIWERMVKMNNKLGYLSCWKVIKYG